MSKSLWIITDRIGWALDAWKEVRGSFLLGLVACYVGLSFFGLFVAIVWLHLQ